MQKPKQTFALEDIMPPRQMNLFTDFSSVWLMEGDSFLIVLVGGKLQSPLGSSQNQ